MDNRKQILLDKWLSGAITYREELELFDLAEEDRMLKDALEGYIGQDEIAPLPIEKIKEWQQVGASIVSDAGSTKDQSGNRRRVALVAVLLIAVVGTVFTLLVSKEGEQAASYIVEVETPKINNQQETNEVISREELAPKAEKSRETTKSTKKTIQLAEKTANEVIEKDVAVNSISAIIENSLNQNWDNQAVEMIQEAVVNDIVVETKEDTQLEEIISEPIVNSTFISMTEQDANHFDDDADDELRDKVYGEAKKDLANEIPITVYDIDIKTGIDPNHPEPYQSDSALINSDVARVEGIEAQADAAGKQKAFITNNVTSNVVIKEYEINKADIYNPPMEDYNSLVRAKYKRKGKPEGGYLKYKQFLRESSTILVDSYKNPDHLEEVLIKFRVHKDGEIEFLELFGVEHEQLIEEIKEAISKGPKWELQDYYESIDIEVPFKVLYPFLF